MKAQAPVPVKRRRPKRPRAATIPVKPPPSGWQDTDRSGLDASTLFLDGDSFVEVSFPHGSRMGREGVLLLAKALDAAWARFPVLPASAPAPKLVEAVRPKAAKPKAPS